MPYIKQDRRKFLGNPHRVNDRPQDGGELNYCITLMIERYIEDHGLKYQNISDVIGALEGAKAEFQRVIVNPYEAEKISENGPVYRPLYHYKEPVTPIGYATLDNGNHDETKD